jgi:hypothetical protein
LTATPFGTKIGAEGAGMDAQDDRLRLEYDQAVQLLRGLAETRFKLLALVPSLSGAVVALSSASTGRIALLGIGALGLVATLGVLVYELRNGQIAAVLRGRVTAIETALYPQGPLVPARGRLTHALGVALVYGAALGGWCYLVAWAFLRIAGAGPHARSLGLAAGVACGVLVGGLVLRVERPPADRPGSEPLSRPA